VPIVYITQLLGLCLGVAPMKLGSQAHGPGLKCFGEGKWNAHRANDIPDRVLRGTAASVWSACDSSPAFARHRPTDAPASIVNDTAAESGD